MAHATTCLWFPPEDAPTAVELYTQVVPNTKVVDAHGFDNADQPDQSVRLWTLEIAGTPFQVMGARRESSFTDAHSIFLVVDDQEQLDRVWDGFLAAGGTEQQCGWILDPYGLPWQVVPQVWVDLTESGDQARAQRATEAVWQMVRIDVATLQRIADDA